MTFEEKLDSITPQILPNGYKFSEQQKKAILADDSSNIVAGPGSGKTTVLIAKYALLLMGHSDINQGISLITHTNVAVEEIKKGLKKIGINNIEYPNFIGTIQEFINNFFARKAYHIIHGENIFRVLDDEEYKEKFDELFQRFKPDFYTYQSPNIDKRNPKLLIDDDLSYSIVSEAPSTYKDAFDKSIKTLFDWGLVNNEQCLELALWYITKYKELIRKALVNRFKYILLDEAQDTSNLQYTILKELFSNSEVIFQKFGDPYQALYNIFDGNSDAWVPIDENITYNEISETSRFGSSIAKILTNLCVEKYDTFASLDLVKSFKPYFIIYENGEDLLQQYRGLINMSKKKSDSFSSSTKNDAIVSTFHKDLEQIFTDYKKPAYKIIAGESDVKKGYNFFLSLLLRKTDSSFKEVKDKINLNLESKIAISKCIKELYSETPIINYILYEINNIFKYLTGKTANGFLKDDINSYIDYFHQNILNKADDLSYEDHLNENSEIYIGTIHSVKGETHRSTLLVLDTIFKDFTTKSEYSMFELLQEYLIGNHLDPMLIPDNTKRNETIKSLKLAYVALSRPTHLMAIAIPSHLIVGDNKDILIRLEDNNWNKYEHLIDPQT